MWKTSFWPSQLTTLLSLFIIACRVADPTAQINDLQESSASSITKHCGAPLVEAWDSKYGTSLRLKSIDQGLSAISEVNITDAFTKLGVLAPAEKSLITTFEKTQPPIVHRMTFAGFMNVFDVRHDGSINSVRAQGREKPRDGGLSNAFEDELYFAWSCAFASIGTFVGNEDYGEVLIALKSPLPATTWATRRSGFGFFNKPSSWTNDQAQFNDMRILFAHTVIVQRDWPKWSAYDAIRLAREGRGSLEDISAILNIQDPLRRRIEWWTYFDKNKILFLESKTDGKIPFQQIDFIEMSAENVQAAKASSRIPNDVIALLRSK